MISMLANTNDNEEFPIKNILVGMNNYAYTLCSNIIYILCLCMLCIIYNYYSFIAVCMTLLPSVSSIHITCGSPDLRVCGMIVTPLDRLAIPH